MRLQDLHEYEYMKLIKYYNKDYPNVGKVYNRKNYWIDGRIKEDEN